jgi:hypothetical protein
MIEFNCVTWNLMCPVPSPLRFLGQKARMERFAETLSRCIDGPICHLDAVVVQESIVNKYTNIIRRDLQTIGFEYVTDALQGKETIVGRTKGVRRRRVG